MYYKLLNKTILTGALVSLICVHVNQVSAQELFGAEDNTNLALPTPKEAPAKIDEDVIPLAKDALIVPEPVVQKAPVPNKVQATAPAKRELPPKPQAPKQDAEDDFDISFDAPENMPAPIIKEQKPEQKPEQKQKANPAVQNNVPPRPQATAPSQARPRPQANVPNRANTPNQASPQNQRRAPNASVAQNKPAQQPQAHQASADGVKFGDSILAQTNNDLFNQMSDIEKQTTLLTLELKREKIKNEVEAAKAVRQRAEQEKLAAEQARIREEEEWKKQQEIKVIKAQEELKQKEIELEKLKQRKALTAYMNSMLEQKQSWIEETSKLYNEISTLKETNGQLRQSYKADLEKVSNESEKVLKNAENAKSNYDRTVASLTAQNTQLKKRIEAMEQAAKVGSSNPFSAKEGDPNAISTSADALIKPINIAKEYAIMEITGKGDELFVKLINKEGDSFTAKTGTVLQTGHMVEEITPTYVQFDRNGLKDFLYTSTAALTAEPANVMTKDVPAAPAQQGPVRPRANLIGDEQLPSLSDSMFVK
ncbi:MAG: hypothetical protein IJ870_04315 [Alphaproteobacteria bacterium]|nr:hypothetical protein [Alphaproteobacteria bacterium]